MSSSSTTTFPLARQTPRKFQSKKKTVKDWSPSLVEGSGDNCRSALLEIPKSNKDSGKFRHHTLPNFEILHKIFHGQVATGKYSQSSTVPPLHEENDVVAQHGHHDANQDQVNSDHNRMSLNTHGGIAARIPLPLPNRKKQKTFSAGLSVASAVKSWEESTAAKSQSRRLRNSLATGVGIHCHSPPPTNSDHETCMQVLQSMSGVDSKAFAIACVSFRDVNHRRVFASINDDQRRLDWIYNHHFASPQLITPPPTYIHRPFEPYTPSYPTPYAAPPSAFSFGGFERHVCPHSGFDSSIVVGGNNRERNAVGAEAALCRTHEYFIHERASSGEQARRDGLCGEFDEWDEYRYRRI